MRHIAYEAYCRRAINRTEMDMIMDNYDDSELLAKLLIDALSLVHEQNEELTRLDDELKDLRHQPF